MNIPSLARRAGVTAALLALAALFAAPAANAAVDDVTWTVRTESNSFGADRAGYEYTLSPGETITDGIVVTNRGAEPLDLGVYAADGFTTEDGGFDLLPAGEKSAKLGTWVTVDGGGVVSVAPGASAMVPFTIAVPANATPGDYGAGIVTSLATADQNAEGVTVDRRLGIRMGVRVDGELAPALAVDDVSVDWGGGLNPFSGDVDVAFTLKNTGNTTIGSVAGVTLAGPFGLLATDAADVGDAPELLPGETWTQKVTVPGFAALVLLTATATVIPASTDAAGTTASLAPVVASGTGWAVPWLLLALILLVVAAIVFVPRMLRARAATRQAREDARVEEAVAAALAK
ncbi:hypothetical protein QFZ53_000082 [Microbacterium natoriense]|uniref:DUF916 domain-containing protein n=1 Tax=Microbacterium natoriense TaxID=284570 RepID=A0AAW8EUH4_9MICO|nr:DUF916 domain-containing protein [Microbacterium natoriense]MDQ0645886.1 hypothetical protein [Microbacterium natoriense]